MSLVNFQRMGGFDVEGKLLRRPSEYSLPDLTPLPANRDFGANSSDSVPRNVWKREMNVAVCFDFCVNDAAAETIPLLLGWQSFLTCKKARWVGAKQSSELTLIENCFSICWVTPAAHRGCQIHAYCLMDNHLHVLVETPRSDLSAGMQWSTKGAL